MHPRLQLVTTALLVAACAGGSTSSSPPGSEPPPTAQTGRTEVKGTMPSGEVLPVVAVFDGDSIAVEREGARVQVRLAGINAPESDECHGDASQDMLAALVGTGPVTLVEVADQDDVDQFGRLLRNVWIDGAWLNEVMVQRGGALALQTGAPDEKALIEAAEDAWQSGLGMWSETACGGFPPGVVITDIRYDPPGRDRDNTDEEFVLIANEGDAPVEMSRWIVRDESSQHRYRFPALTLEPGDGVRLRTGCGTDNGRDLYWCAGDAVWSNGGDTVLLQTADGTVVARLSYAGDF